MSQSRDRKRRRASELITELIVQNRRRLCHGVESTQPLTPEGKQARKELRAFVAELQRIARDSETEHLIRGVELFWGNVRGELPNWDAGGSIN
jgi:hypothetical protein